MKKKIFKFLYGFLFYVVSGLLADCVIILSISLWNWENDVSVVLLNVSVVIAIILACLVLIPVVMDIIETIKKIKAEGKQDEKNEEKEIK